MSIIAWYGTVKMQEAKWTDKEGSTVTFKLPMGDGAEGRRNPFQSFTKRRKGMAGTRFMMACHSVGGVRQAIYEDEVMLCGWNDSQTTGHTVKFWLCSDTLGHPFEGFERGADAFAVSLVELDDDQEAIDQKVRDRVERQGTRPSERLSYVAAMLCKNADFRTYLRKIFPEWDEDNAVYYLGDLEGYCRWCLYDNLDIKSRAELDTDETAARRFKEMVLKSWQETLGEPH